MTDRIKVLAVPFLTVALGFAASFAGIGGAVAADAAPGTKINKANIDQVKDMTFEGHRIGELIPERIEWQIKTMGMELTLAKSTPESGSLDPRVVEATKKFSSNAKLDTNTFLVTGWTAGVPFPDIDVKDPWAGVKVVWNYTYGQPRGDHFHCPFTFNLVDGNTGMERVQNWIFARYYMLGRVTGGSMNIGDGSIYHKSLLFATGPQDIKGLGTFSIRYNDPKFDDIWAYVRSVRRIRRLSGGAWMDPIGGTDHLADDLETFNAHPAWYKGYKLLGKQYVLAVSNSQSTQPDRSKRWSWFPKEGSDEARFPRMDLAHSPYWNPIDIYEVRPVYIVESTPPDYHPMTKRVNWFDASNWRPYYAAAYDRKGDFWKWIHFSTGPWPSIDGWTNPATGKPVDYMFTYWGVNIDHQRRHATFFNIAEGCTMNAPGALPDDYSLAQLEAAGR